MQLITHEIIDKRVIGIISKMCNLDAVKVIVIGQINQSQGGFSAVNEMFFPSESQEKISEKLGKFWRKKLAEQLDIPVTTVYSWCQNKKANLRKLSSQKIEKLIELLEGVSVKSFNKKIDFSEKNQRKIADYFGIQFARGWQKKLANALQVTPSTISTWLKRNECISKHFPTELIELLGE